MTARDLIERLQARSITIEVFGGRLRASPASRLTADEVALLRLHKADVIAWLAPQLSEPIPRTIAPPITMTAEAVELFHWFAANRHRMPAPPFDFLPGQRVEGMKFYDALELDIRDSPGGPRYRMGTLQSDLARLREIVDSNAITQEQEIAA